MKPSQTIFLKPGQVVNIDGVDLTREEIKNNKIDSHMFRKHLKELEKLKSR